MNEYDTRQWLHRQVREELRNVHAEFDRCYHMHVRTAMLH